MGHISSSYETEPDTTDTDTVVDMSTRRYFPLALQRGIHDRRKKEKRSRLCEERCDPVQLFPCDPYIPETTDSDADESDNNDPTRLTWRAALYVATSDNSKRQRLH